MDENELEALIERLESRNVGEMSEFADGWESAIQFAEKILREHFTKQLTE